MKRTTRTRNREEGSSKEKIEEGKARRKIELKCASVDDLIDKLKAFTGALHKNRGLNTDMVQNHSKWKRYVIWVNTSMVVMVTDAQDGANVVGIKSLIPRVLVSI
ncbi:hypothetical protein PIB30_042914 [Stylosanthes scabra]|uniref:Uncharacterized protein n=1 Tax=Stylosanthes scabra TaxID=79078 RepID=A0ABU6VHL9_9FABA|nr:hypothetical protein [Stylosanthes scabra]